MRTLLIPFTLSLCACGSKMVAPPGSTTPDPNAPINEADRPGVVSYLKRRHQFGPPGQASERIQEDARRLRWSVPN